ncbi:GHMP kinase [Candidatus Bathyarchaeota archaeon]|nr:GHMP kinase [Candidatus Bathyarchaeota archaeon]MBL7080165.1 GHMP kinase [Candidatus Bathyarchaeota archaeon]
MKEASAFAPGHLTGFFQICDEAEDPLRKGSRGAGFSIDIGVQTRVQVEPSERDVISVVMNGSVTREAVVSENTVRRMLTMAEEPQRVEVTHEIETPIGAGFGSSGGGALTIALAMNEALDLGLSHVDASRVAHLAEIECKTGLGSVFAATQGGFGVLYKPGAPGIGKSIKYDRSDELTAFCVHFGPISTSEALSDPVLRRRINDLGGDFVDEIKGNLDPSRFMELSREFTDYVGITTPRLRVVLDAADKAGVPCSMAMFGEALFSLVEKDEAGRVAEFYRETVSDQKVRPISIDERGAHLL